MGHVYPAIRNETLINLVLLLLLERLLIVVNENGNSKCSLLGSDPSRRVVVIRLYLIGHYLAGPLF